MLFHWSLETQNHKQNDLYNALSKSSPTMYTLVEELYDSYDYFWGFQDFLIYLAKRFRSLLNSPCLNLQLLFCKSNVNKTV